MDTIFSVMFIAIHVFLSFFKPSLAAEAITQSQTQRDGRFQLGFFKSGVYGSLLASASIDKCDDYIRCGPNGMCDIRNSEVCSCLKGFQPKDPQNWEYADNYAGCVRVKPLMCQTRDVFFKYGGVKLPDATNSQVEQSRSVEECKASCLNNCSCIAYASSSVKGGGSDCTVWFGDLMSLRQLPDSGQDLYVRMLASESKNSSKTKIIAIAVSAVSIVLGIFLAVYYTYRRRQKFKEKLGKDGMMGQNTAGQKEDLELPLFSLSTLITATDNFSFNTKLGEGGFGSVYKGRLEDGQEMAVKRLSQNSGQGQAEFKNEVILIAKLQHRNLVKLIGCCIEGEYSSSEAESSSKNETFSLSGVKKETSSTIESSITVLEPR